MHDIIVAYARYNGAQNFGEYVIKIKKMGKRKYTCGYNDQIACPYQNIPEYLPRNISRLALKNPFTVHVKINHTTRNGADDACRQVPQSEKVYRNNGDTKIGCRSY